MENNEQIHIVSPLVKTWNKKLFVLGLVVAGAFLSAILVAISVSSLNKQTNLSPEASEPVNTSLEQLKNETGLGPTKPSDLIYAGNVNNLVVNRFEPGTYTVKANSLNCTSTGDCEPDKYEFRLPFNGSARPNVFGAGMHLITHQAELEDFSDASFSYSHCYDMAKSQSGSTYAMEAYSSACRMRTPIMVFPQHNLLIAYLQPYSKMVRLTRTQQAGCPANTTCVVMKLKNVQSTDLSNPLGSAATAPFVVIKKDNLDDMYRAYKVVKEHLGYVDKEPTYMAYGPGWETFAGLGCLAKNTTSRQEINYYANNKIIFSYATIGSGYWDSGKTPGCGGTGNTTKLISTTDTLKVNVERWGGYDGLNSWFSFLEQSIPNRDLTGRPTLGLIGMRHRVNPYVEEASVTEDHKQLILDKFTALNISNPLINNSILFQDRVHPNDRHYLLKTDAGVIDNWIELITKPKIDYWQESFNTLGSSWVRGGDLGCQIQVKSGSVSPDQGTNLWVFRPNQVTGDCNIDRAITPPMASGKVSLWFYDNNVSTNPINAVTAIKDTNNQTIWLGVRSVVNSAKYSYFLMGQEYITNINRTSGWHKFEFVRTQGKTYAMLDGVSLESVGSRTNFGSFASIRIASNWAANSAIRVDGVKINSKTDTTGYGNFKGIKHDDMTLHDQFNVLTPTPNLPTMTMSQIPGNLGDDYSTKVIPRYTSKLGNQFVILTRNSWVANVGDLVVPDYIHEPRPKYSTNQTYQIKYQQDAAITEVMSGYPLVQNNVSNGDLFWDVDTTNIAKDVFFRHTQMATFMPGSIYSINFSRVGDTTMENAMIFYAKLRNRLHHYAYDQAMKSYTTGSAHALRPLFFDYQNDNVYKLYNHHVNDLPLTDPRKNQPKNEFMFGNAFLVRPLFEASTESQSIVYFPPGIWKPFLNVEDPIVVTNSQGVFQNYNHASANKINFPVFMKEKEIFIMADQNDYKKLYANVYFHPSTLNVPNSVSSEYLFYVDDRNTGRHSNEYRLQAKVVSANQVILKNLSLPGEPSVTMSVDAFGKNTHVAELTSTIIPN